MTKKLWTVTFSDEIIVLAESEEEAREIAEDNKRELDFEPESVLETTYLPGGWELDSLPFGTDDDQSIGKLIEQGAAPEYTKRLERIKAKKKDGE